MAASMMMTTGVVPAGVVEDPEPVSVDLHSFLGSGTI